MQKHRKKMVAPVVVMAIIAFQHLAIAVGLFIAAGVSGWSIWFILGIVVSVIMAVVSLAVLIERIKEIQKEIQEGEEDDLSNY